MPVPDKSAEIDRCLDAMDLLICQVKAKAKTEATTKVAKETAMFVKQVVDEIRSPVPTPVENVVLRRKLA